MRDKSSGIGARLTELRQSSAAGTHGKPRKAVRASDIAAAIEESMSAVYGDVDPRPPIYEQLYSPCVGSL